MKRLIVCCDGTWQKLSSPYPTNVVKIAQAIKPVSDDGIPQIVFYDEGIGSGNTAEKIFGEVDKILGGAFGIGIDTNIQDCYRFLSLNYHKGDEIYLFGFSRGSYTVRSLAGLIRCSGGLLSLPNIREAPFAYELYRDNSLTLPEKELLRKLPLPRDYEPNVEQIKACRQEALGICRDRRHFTLADKEKITELRQKLLQELKPDEQLTLQTLEQKEQQDAEQKQLKVQALLKDKYKLPERHDQDIRQAVNITLLGCWDTVGSLGIPPTVPLLSRLTNAKYQFHDCRLSSIIQHALHAVSIDENRRVFNVTPMQRKPDDPQELTLKQVWFPGGHGSIGGGSRQERELSDAALLWMMNQIQALGLGLDFERTAVEDGIYPNYKGLFNTKPKLLYKLLGLIQRDVLKDEFNSLHESTKLRWRDDKTYHHPTETADQDNLLQRYRTDLEAWCQQNPCLPPLK